MCLIHTGPVIAQEVFSFADLRSTADQVRPSKGFATALAEIIRILIKDKVRIKLGKKYKDTFFS